MPLTADPGAPLLHTDVSPHRPSIGTLKTKLNLTSLTPLTAVRHVHCRVRFSLAIPGHACRRATDKIPRRVVVLPCESVNRNWLLGTDIGK